MIMERIQTFSELIVLWLFFLLELLLLLELWTLINVRRFLILINNDVRWPIYDLVTDDRKLNALNEYEKRFLVLAFG